MVLENGIPKIFIVIVLPVDVAYDNEQRMWYFALNGCSKDVVLNGRSYTGKLRLT